MECLRLSEYACLGTSTEVGGPMLGVSKRELVSTVALSLRLAVRDSLPLRRLPKVGRQDLLRRRQVRCQGPGQANG